MQNSNAEVSDTIQIFLGGDDDDADAGSYKRKE